MSLCGPSEYIDWYKSYHNQHLYTCNADTRLSSVPDRIFCRQFVHFLHMLRAACIGIALIALLHIAFAGYYCKAFGKLANQPKSILNLQFHTFFLGVFAFFVAIFTLHASVLARRFCMVIAVVLLALLTMYLVWIVFIMCIRGKNWTEFLLPMSSTDWKEGGSEKRDGYSRRQLEESSSQLENPIESNEEDEDARSVDGDQHDTTTTESLTEFEESTIGILTEVTMDFIEPTVLASLKQPELISQPVSSPDKKKNTDEYYDDDYITDIPNPTVKHLKTASYTKAPSRRNIETGQPQIKPPNSMNSTISSNFQVDFVGYDEEYLSLTTALLNAYDNADHFGEATTVPESVDLFDNRNMGKARRHRREILQSMKAPSNVSKSANETNPGRTLDTKLKKSIQKQNRHNSIISVRVINKTPREGRGDCFVNYFFGFPKNLDLLNCKKDKALYVGFFLLLYCYFAGAALILALAVIFLPRTHQW